MSLAVFCRYALVTERECVAIELETLEGRSIHRIHLPATTAPELRDAQEVHEASGAAISDEQGKRATGSAEPTAAYRYSETGVIESAQRVNGGCESSEMPRGRYRQFCPGHDKRGDAITQD